MPGRLLVGYMCCPGDGRVRRRDLLNQSVSIIAEQAESRRLAFHAAVAVLVASRWWGAVAGNFRTDKKVRAVAEPRDPDRRKDLNVIDGHSSTSLYTAHPRWAGLRLSVHALW